MRNTFNVLFYIKRSSPLRDGSAPIMGRITINGQRAQFSTRLSVAAERWDVRTGRVPGHDAGARRINLQLARIRTRIESCYDALLRERQVMTPQMVREMFFGEDLRRHSLIAFFRRHNEDFSRQVGISKSRSTYYKYRCVCKHLETYILRTYRRPDLPLMELDTGFLTGFHAYLVREGKHRKNTVWIYLIALKHILMLARSRGYMTRDIFASYKLHGEPVFRNHLTLDELIRLIRYRSDSPTRQLVRDAFLFSCFTGLSYVDLRELTPQHIETSRDTLWIRTKRHKTGTGVDVRLLAVPRSILQRRMPQCSGEPLFDLPCNGWSNVCLRRIASEAGIGKRLTFHTARHTFATTVTLSQGMAIETISRLLGHKDIRTTQIYAAITRERIDSEMERLSRKIDPTYDRLLSEEGERPGGTPPELSIRPKKDISGKKQAILTKKRGFKL